MVLQCTFFFPPPIWCGCDGGCSGIITNKYWFEYMGLSEFWITVMVPGIIESVQIVIWANEWIVPRALLEFPHLEMVMCGNSFHCLARGGRRIVKWVRGAPLCMSQSVLSPALWWNFCVCAVLNNAVCYLHSGIFIGAITQSSRVSVCIYVYRGGDTACEKLLTIVCT